MGKQKKRGDTFTFLHLKIYTTEPHKEMMCMINTLVKRTRIRILFDRRYFASTEKGQIDIFIKILNCNHVPLVT